MSLSPGLRKALLWFGAAMALALVVVWAFRLGMNAQQKLAQLGCTNTAEAPLSLDVPDTKKPVVRFIALGDTGRGNEAQAWSPGWPGRCAAGKAAISCCCWVIIFTRTALTV